MKLKLFLFALCLSCNSVAADKTLIRLGVQAGGTVAWELPELQAFINANALDFQLDIHPLNTAQEGKKALQNGLVDMIVTDWIWVSSAREQGADFTFYPYSDKSGALVVAADSPIKSIADLAGKRLGIAGSALDKNWLLLQTLAKQQHDVDLDAAVNKVFAAPAELNQQLQQGQVDAILNYWHYAAQLESEGYRTVVDGPGILNALGINVAVANLGFVFKQSWGEQHPAAIKQFIAASKQARQNLCKNDAAWQKTLPLTDVDGELAQKHLRQNYCAGAIDQWGEAEQQALDKVYVLLHKQSQQALTGQAEHIQAGTFWQQQP